MFPVLPSGPPDHHYVTVTSGFVSVQASGLSEGFYLKLFNYLILLLLYIYLYLFVGKTDIFDTLESATSYWSTLVSVT